MLASQTVFSTYPNRFKFAKHHGKIDIRHLFYYGELVKVKNKAELHIKFWVIRIHLMTYLVTVRVKIVPVNKDTVLF